MNKPYCETCGAMKKDFCCCIPLVCDGKPKKPLLGVVVDICDDFENGEHVDSQWVKDSFQLQGYTIIPNKEYLDSEQENQRLKKQLEEAVVIIERVAGEHFIIDDSTDYEVACEFLRIYRGEK